MPLSEIASQRPRILCIVDGPDWIFQRHVATLTRYLGDQFDFSIAIRGQPYHESEYDLIYPLEFNMVKPDQITQPGKYVTGIRSFVSWVEWDFLTFVNFLVTHFLQVHVVSRQLFDIFSPYIPDLWHVTHGVDLEHFSPVSPVNSPAGKLRLGWAGNRDTIVKGFQEYIQPLSAIPGVELIFHGYSDQNLTYEQMPGFYNSIDSYICASSFEGNNNSLLEAAAMERAIITTPTGAVPEYLRHNHSALIVDRNLDQMKASVIRLRDDAQLRNFLGKNARQALVNGGWDWRCKAEEYRKFFQSALNARNPQLGNRIVIEPANFQHLASTLHSQFVLERELRIGSGMRIIELEGKLASQERISHALQIKINDLEVHIKNLEVHIKDLGEYIKAIQESETYVLATRVTSLGIVKFLINLYKLYKARHHQ